MSDPTGRRRVLAGLTAALATATVVAPLATLPVHAGPDDGKTVATLSHVDAPKIYWQDGKGFTLRASSKSGPVPVDKTVVWVGKGWAKNDGVVKHQMVVPQNPVYGFLGTPGEVLYRAPQDGSYDQTPVWVGYGADAGLPFERFRDRTVALDVLKVSGPGDIEWWVDTGWDDAPMVKRLLSSRTPSLRSVLMAPQGETHTHMNTTFTKTGRYEVTYRAVARDAKTCQPIASAPQTMSWQVGGARPGATPTPSTKKRYDAASTAKPVGYTFAITPPTASGPEAQKKGEDKLSTLSLTTKNPVDGLASVFVDGYFLTDIPVKGGKGSWREVLSNRKSSYQVVFTAGSDAGRWISPRLDYRLGGSAVRATSAQSGTFPKPRPDHADVPMPTGPRDLTDRGYTATVEPAGQGKAKVSVTFKDPSMMGEVTGGFYAEGETDMPEEPVEGSVIDGKFSYLVDESEYSTQGAAVRLRVRPHPDLNVAATTITLPGTHKIGKKQTVSGEMAASCAGTAPTSTPPTSTPPTTTVPTSTAPTSTATAPTSTPPSTTTPPTSTTPSSTPPTTEFPACLDRAVVLDSGHVDLAASLGQGGLTMKLKDGTGLLEPGTVMREVDDVALRADHPLSVTRSETVLGAPELDVLGPHGTRLWVLPQTQKSSIIWPGHSTEAVDYGQLKPGTPVVWELASLKGPGDLTVFQTGGLFGAPRVLLSSAGTRSTNLDMAAHAHANWVFTQPGVYELGFRYRATAKDGSALDTGVKTLKVSVATTACETS